ncbi:serine hydrolase domain-containing protein [Nonlabens marinus]|uniref:Beta-lactamase n=1 Tax=Nonlabens marinus S1-08 TaxID=1454201 RepID=W8VVQ0_9FLAO|nr:serine hydrolase domain-containing protein [Nonlabens marinus]BAO54067.1 beta-lactamase [Nonlabens marinus S1-08]
MKASIYKLTLALGLLFFISCSNAQTTTAVNGMDFRESGIEKEQLELIYNKVKSFPNNTQLSIAVIQNKEITYVGVKRVKDTIRLVDNYQDAFEIGSITKVFTATLLANLVQDEQVKLDDNIQDYLDFKLNTEEEITFQQLANHTSGLPRLPSNLNLLLVDQDNPYKDYNREKLTTYLTDAMKLNQKPGIKNEYSNLGAGILGFELALISNSTYEELLQEKIFSRYAMTNSTSKRDQLKPNLIKGQNTEGEVTSNWDFEALAGGGAIFSTVEDLSKFGLAQFNKENAELALTHQPTFKINENMSIGLGWHVLKRKNGGELIWHNGGTGGYTSSMALDVEHNNGIIILSNVSAFHPQMGNMDQLCFGLINTLDNN